MARRRSNPAYLTELTFPASVTPTSELERALEYCDLVVSVVPSHGTRDVIARARPLVRPHAVIVSATKGLEEEHAAASVGSHRRGDAGSRRRRDVGAELRVGGRPWDADSGGGGLGGSRRGRARAGRVPIELPASLWLLGRRRRRDRRCAEERHRHRRGRRRGDVDRAQRAGRADHARARGDHAPGDSAWWPARYAGRPRGPRRSRPDVHRAR